MQRTTVVSGLNGTDLTFLPQALVAPACIANGTLLPDAACDTYFVGQNGTHYNATDFARPCNLTAWPMTLPDQVTPLYANTLYAKSDIWGSLGIYGAADRTANASSVACMEGFWRGQLDAAQTTDAYKTVAIIVGVFAGIGMLSLTCCAACAVHRRLHAKPRAPRRTMLLSAAIAGTLMGGLCAGLIFLAYGAAHRGASPSNGLAAGVSLGGAATGAALGALAFS